MKSIQRKQVIIFLYKKIIIKIKKLANRWHNYITTIAISVASTVWKLSFLQVTPVEFVPSKFSKKNGDIQFISIGKTQNNQKKYIL